MCWVPKNPPPWDFCNNPPCPICFDWVMPAQENQPQCALTGIDKFALDMLGASIDDLSESQVIALNEQAQLVHERNLAPKKDAFTEMDEAQRMRMWLDSKRKEKKPVVAVSKLKMTLDQICRRSRPRSPRSRVSTEKW